MQLTGSVVQRVPEVQTDTSVLQSSPNVNSSRLSSTSVSELTAVAQIHKNINENPVR